RRLCLTREGGRRARRARIPRRCGANGSTSKGANRMAGILAVTGGSRGIGAAVARAAAARGYSVAVNYKTNRARAEAVVAAIAESGGRAIAVAGDVAREADVLRLFET